MTDTAEQEFQFIGQQHIVRRLLPELRLARREGRQLPHSIFYGAPGLGKDHLVDAIVRYFRTPHVIEVMGTDIKTAGRKGTWQWAAIFDQLDPSPTDHGMSSEGTVCGPNPLRIVVLNEAEQAPRDALEQIHPALQPDQLGRRLINYCSSKRLSQYATVWVPDFTLIVITNYLDVFLRNGWAAAERCTFRLEFRPYSEAELAEIISQYSRGQEVPIYTKAAQAIGRRSKGNPRRAKQLWELCNTERLLADARVIEQEHVLAVMDREEIAPDGLTHHDLQYMKVLSEQPNGNPIGSTRLAGILGIPQKFMEQEIEPWLQTRGYVVVAGGRILTADGLHRIHESGLTNLRLVRRTTEQE